MMQATSSLVGTPCDQLPATDQEEVPVEGPIQASVQALRALAWALPVPKLLQPAIPRSRSASTAMPASRSNRWALPSNDRAVAPSFPPDAVASSVSASGAPNARRVTLPGTTRRPARTRYLNVFMLAPHSRPQPSAHAAATASPLARSPCRSVRTSSAVTILVVDRYGSVMPLQRIVQERAAWILCNKDGELV